MMQSLIIRFALRCLRRNLRRTWLSIIGVAVGVAVAVIISAFMRGGTEMRLRAISGSGFGHMRIAPAAWEKTRDNDLRLHDWEAELAAARALPAVRVAAPHARATALLAFGTRVVGVELLGVDPLAEAEGNRLVGALSEGRYLRSGERGAIVAGGTILDRLDVELEDDLFLTVVGVDGEMQYAMLRVVGVVRTGSRDMDATISHVSLEELEAVTGYGGAGEITLTLHDPDDMPATQAALNEVIATEDRVLPWQVVLPSQGGDAESDAGFMGLIVGIVILVVTLGITSSRMTAILERKREFAVLIALGMKGRQIIGVVLLESIAVGLLGAALGLVIAVPLVYHTATAGLDFSGLLGDDFSMGGVLFDPVIHTHLGGWIISDALLVGLIATFLATLYPAWLAVRVDPRSALSLRDA